MSNVSQPLSLSEYDIETKPVKYVSAWLRDRNALLDYISLSLNTINTWMVGKTKALWTERKILNGELKYKKSPLFVFKYVFYWFSIFKSNI